MRRSFIFTTLILFLVSVAYGQKSLHFNIGLNHGQVLVLDPSLPVQSKGKANHYLGLEARKTNRKGYLLACQLLWVRKSFDVSTFWNETLFQEFTYRFDYISLIPRLYSPTFRHTRLNLGAELGYCMGERGENITLYQPQGNKVARPFQFSLNPGVSVHFNQWTGIISLNLGLHRFGRDKILLPSDGYLDLEFINRGFQLGIAYQISKEKSEEK